MGKVRTRKSLTTRLKVTKNGKVTRRQSFRRHIHATKSSKQLRSLKRIKLVTGFFAKKIRRVMGTKTRHPKKLESTK